MHNGAGRQGEGVSYTQLETLISFSLKTNHPPKLTQLQAPLLNRFINKLGSPKFLPMIYLGFI